MSLAVYPWPQQLEYDVENSEQVKMWENFCRNRCKHFFNFFPYFFESKNKIGYLDTYKKYYWWNDIHLIKLGIKYSKRTHKGFKMKIVGFILSRNNGNLIEKAIKKCPKCIDEIFISDDKSNDNTHEVAEKNGVQVFTNEKVNGYGGNVKNALKIAFENFDADYAVEIHGDGAQFHPDATYDALKIINDQITKPDLILGSRFLNFKKT